MCHSRHFLLTHLWSVLVRKITHYFTFSNHLLQSHIDTYRSGKWFINALASPPSCTCSPWHHHLFFFFSAQQISSASVVPLENTSCTLMDWPRLALKIIILEATKAFCLRSGWPLRPNTRLWWMRKGEKKTTQTPAATEWHIIGCSLFTLRLHQCAPETYLEKHLAGLSFSCVWLHFGSQTDTNMFVHGSVLLPSFHTCTHENTRQWLAHAGNPDTRKRHLCTGYPCFSSRRWRTVEEDQVAEE